MSNTKIWACSLLMIAAVVVLFFTASTLPLFIFSAILAYLLFPLLKFLEKKLKCKRWVSTILVMIILLACITLIILAIIPPLVSQAQSLASDFSNIEKFGSQFSNFVNNIKDTLIERNTPDYIINNINTALSKGFEFITTLLGTMVTGFINGAGKALNVVIILVVTVYFLLDSEKLINSFKNSMPNKFKNRINKIILATDAQLKGYIKAQIIASLAVAAACGIGFWIIGLKYALILTIITFALNFIPFFGSIIAGLLAVLVALFTGGLTHAIIVAIICLVFQQLQGNVLSPILQSDAANIHPITVMFSLLACSALWGVGGMFIAVPVAGIVKLCFKESAEVISEMH